jgi:phospholipase/carboxylesterase
MAGENMQISTLRCDWFAASKTSGKVMVVLHGRGDSSEGFHWMPRELAIPGLNYLMVNAPDPYLMGYSWYDLPPNQTPGVRRSCALLDRVFEEVFAQGFAPADAALFGFSQGCLMTLEWGGRTAHPLAAYIGVSGYVLDAQRLLAERHPASQRPVWLVTHGTEDDVLPFEATRAQIERLSVGGWPLLWHAFKKGHTVDPERELPLIRAFAAEHLGIGC